MLTCSSPHTVNALRHSIRCLALLFAMGLCTMSAAQTISDVAFTLRGDTLTLTYSLDVKADICVRVAIAGGRYSAPLQGLSGAVGRGVKPGTGLTVTAVGLPDIHRVDSSELSFLVEVDDGALLVYAGEVPFRMMPVEGGSFMMGCSHPKGEYNTYVDELPAHKVTLNSYYIGQYEVTQRLWVAVMGENPSKWTGNDSLPVEQVSWNDAQIFIARLSQMTGYRFRLPTEAEWEYAARGGNRTHHFRYPGSRSQAWECCWFTLNSDGHSHPVGRLLPNELGIYDMVGNVMEWCSDWLAAYGAQPQSCPQGPRQGENRILRGGCFNSPGWVCSVYERSWYLPDYRYSYFGFRVALDNAERDDD